MTKRLPKLQFPRFLRCFIDTEAAGGVLMIIAASLAMFAANSGFAALYHDFINAPLTISFAGYSANWPLNIWVRDVLIVLFFLLVGMELKREAAEGFLHEKEQVMLPMLAALGGMAAPAIIYLLINSANPANFAGWAIPSATDIAFALCILLLVGRGIPPSVKIFLLAIAIFDDLGAILIIAFFYSGALNYPALALAVAGVLGLLLLNRLQVRFITAYILLGVYLWFCLHASGVHTTIAGVLTGLFMPMRAGKNKEYSPVNQCIHFLHPWVVFGVLPLFAFVSAGVSLAGITIADIMNPLPLGIALALFLGKQIGIFGTSYAVIKSGFASLPEGASCRHIYGVSIIAGIGFTMSLFIGILAFPEAMQDMVKIGVISGSLLSVIWGAVILFWARKK